jgi:hypothetical protein
MPAKGFFPGIVVAAALPSPPGAGAAVIPGRATGVEIKENLQQTSRVAGL